MFLIDIIYETYLFAIAINKSKVYQIKNQFLTYPQFYQTSIFSILYLQLLKLLFQIFYFLSIISFLWAFDVCPPSFLPSSNRFWQNSHQYISLFFEFMQLMHLSFRSFEIYIPIIFSFFNNCSLISIRTLFISQFISFSLLNTFNSKSQFTSQQNYIFIDFIFCQTYSILIFLCELINKSLSKDYYLFHSLKLKIVSSLNIFIKMKCVSIVYRRPNQNNLMSQFIPIRTVKRSVDQYYEKLRQKQSQQSKFTIRAQPSMLRSTINTSQSTRSSKPHRIYKNVDSINVMKIRGSSQSVMKQQYNPEQIQQKKQKKFRSTFVKRKDSNGFYSLKGIKMQNNNFFQQQRQKILLRRVSQENKNNSKIVNLKKLKLIKTTTVLLSIDFILNENNFWQEQNIDETAHRNWKVLQQHSNIIWLTKRQNSFKKLQKYANEHGLRLDGVYQIMPKKKYQTLTLSLSNFEKDFKSQAQINKNQQFKRQIIVLNSLKVQSIKNIGYQQFYNAFPIAKTLRCIVHFVQIDMNDKQRFNSPLKILSKQKLPHPNCVNHLFKEFFKNENKTISATSDLYIKNQYQELEQEQGISKQEMLEKYQQIKQDFIDYFNHNLKVNLNKKVRVDQNQFSLQFLIGDMLRRNFNIMYSYKKQCKKLHRKLQKVKSGNESLQNCAKKSLTKLEPNHLFKNPNLKIKINIQQLLQSKLSNEQNFNNTQMIMNGKSQNLEDNKLYYKELVFLWKK